MRLKSTHVGSLIRPDELLAARFGRDGSPELEAAHTEALEKAVDEVVAKQAEIGLDIINDGEYSKVEWMGYVAERLSGLEIRQDRETADKMMARVTPGRDRERFPAAYQELDDEIAKLTQLEHLRIRGGNIGGTVHVLPAGLGGRGGLVRKLAAKEERAVGRCVRAWAGDLQDTRPF